MGAAAALEEPGCLEKPHADAVLMFLGRGLRSLLMLLGRGESVSSWCFGRCLVLVLRKDKNESVALNFFWSWCH
jgi:hypothetical protein